MPIEDKLTAAAADVLELRGIGEDVFKNINEGLRIRRNDGEFRGHARWNELKVFRADVANDGFCHGHHFHGETAVPADTKLIDSEIGLLVEFHGLGVRDVFDDEPADVGVLSCEVIAGLFDKGSAFYVAVGRGMDDGERAIDAAWEGG